MKILFDLGATNLRVALTDGKRILKIQKEKTPLKFEKGIELIKEMVGRVSSGEKIDAVCGGVGASLDGKKEGVYGTLKSSMSDWFGKPLKKRLEKELGASVILENDVALAALGEAVWGVGRNKNIVAYVTLSSGINGARIVDGRIDKTTYGFEIGNQIISFPSRKPIRIEQLIGGVFIQKSFKKSPLQIKNKRFWNNFEEILCLGLNNLCVFWSPEVIILGGSISKAVKITRVEKRLKDLLKIYPATPIILKAKLGDNSGLYGAMKLLQKEN
jgi:predicted NBD/HSP70 family sugar kinase